MIAQTLFRRNLAILIVGETFLQILTLALPPVAALRGQIRLVIGVAIVTSLPQLAKVLAYAAQLGWVLYAKVVGERLRVHPSRNTILKKLEEAKGPIPFHQLRKLTGLGASPFKHHVAKLVGEEMIHQRRQGRSVFLSSQSFNAVDCLRATDREARRLLEKGGRQADLVRAFMATCGGTKAGARKALIRAEEAGWASREWRHRAVYFRPCSPPAGLGK